MFPKMMCNMAQVLHLVRRLFKQVDQQIGSESGMKLDEVELSVEISGEGEVKLMAGDKAILSQLHFLPFRGIY